MSAKIIERNLKNSEAARKVFNIGDWVFGIGEHTGCSQVFEGTYKDFQPFSYLNDFDPKNYRIATEKEILEATQPKEKL